MLMYFTFVKYVDDDNDGSFSVLTKGERFYEIAHLSSPMAAHQTNGIPRKMNFDF